MAQSMIQSVDRALGLLWAVRDHPGMTLSELSESADLLPSTALRLLVTLERHELVERDPADRRYRIGPGIRALAGASNASHERLRTLLEPMLRELAGIAREQAAVGVLDGACHLNIAMVDGATAAGHDVVLRSDAPKRQTNLNATAIGKILLAHSETATSEDIIRRLSFEPTARRTITDADALRRHLNTVRRNGYASSLEENSPEVAGIAVPVRDATGKVVAALSINGPAVRLPRARLHALLPLLQESARSCSATLGFVDVRPAHR